MTVKEIGLVAIGFVAGMFLTSSAIAYSAREYDATMRMFAALRSRYGSGLERKPSA